MELIIVGAIVPILLFIFAKSADREVNRISVEADYRLDGLNASVESLGHLLRNNDREAEKLERKAARFRARANEVASRQGPGWNIYSKAVRRGKS